MSAIACATLTKDVLMANKLPEGLLNLIQGDSEIGERMSSDKRISLISATGSTRMGKSVAQIVSKRFQKTLLELGGNNAIIVTKNADLDMH